jgi:hypothetical protein
MIDPNRYFLPDPVLDRREPTRNSRRAEPPTLAREELEGGCALYRPLSFVRKPSEAGLSMKAALSTQEVQP